MARQYTDANTEYLINTSGFVMPSLPITMFAWFWRDGTTGVNQTILSVADNSESAQYYQMGISDGGNVIAVQRGSGGITTGTTSTSISNSTWNTAIARFVSTTSRHAYLNNAGLGSDTTSNTTTGVDAAAIGATADTSPAQEMNGRIAEAAIWSADLTATERSQLDLGMSPLLVRPADLIFYHQGHEGTGNGLDIVGGLVLTDTGTVTDADHPPEVMYPSQPIVYGPVAAASTGVGRLINGGLIR